MSSMTLADFVRDNAPSRQYYEQKFPSIRWPASGTDGRVSCVFHNDSKTPSLSLSPETGKWFCHSCEAGGNSIISFHAKANEITNKEAAEELYDQFIHPVIPIELINAWHDQLLTTPSALSYLTKERFLSIDVIVSRLLGWNGNQVVIPIFNEYNLCVNAKLYDPLNAKRDMPKMVNYRDKSKREYGSPPMLYPIQSMTSDTIHIEEGEFKALFSESMGIPSVTTTAGSKSWPSQYNELFRGKRVVLGGDNDEPGGKYRERAQRNLSLIAKEIAERDLTPPEIGKDAPDWYAKDQNARTPTFWRMLCDNAHIVLQNEEAVYAQSETLEVELANASLAKYYNKRIRVNAVVTGKDIAPYMLPKTARVTCSKECDICPIHDDKRGYREVKVDTITDALEFIDKVKPVVDKKLALTAGMPCEKECKTKVEVVDTFNVESMVLIPTIKDTYVVRNAYYIGHGLQSNRGYSLEGTTLPDPNDQHATHLFDKCRPLQDEIESFSLTSELVTKLAVFKPRNLGIMAHLMNIAEWQSRNITKIKERPDLHIAVDLAFHSAAAFEFNGELITRGMLDILIIGDTRCGKGYVTEGLTKYYGLGEVASGENCSFAGLVGGAQQVGKRWFITWGVIPLNHGRLVVIDEAGALSTMDFSKFSRVRSEGVAEISKIVRESTRASTRLVWLSNPRSGKRLAEYNNGAHAIKELIGANEDISRFDFALTVAANEVSSEVINTTREDTFDSPMYSAELCRALVLWCWSRRPDQIKFTPEATMTAIASAIEFGKSYTSNIPLVQGENIRIKIAKIATAVAGRVFSTDNGEHMIVKEEHVRAACHYLRDIYAKPSMAYDMFSDRSIARTKIETMGPIESVFNKLASDKQHTITGLRDLFRITADSLADFIGDVNSARVLISELVKLNCLERMDNYYYKNPAFKTWLNNNVPTPPTNGQGDTNGKALQKSSRANGRATEAH